MADFYTDDSGLMFANATDLSVNQTVVSNQTLTLGLADIGATQTMSTWLIDHVYWSVIVTQESSTPLSEWLVGTIQMGVAPTTHVGTLNTPGDYQDIKGFPLKKGHRIWMVSDQGSSIRTSVSGSWTPRNNTALNRLQEFNLNCSLASSQNGLSECAVFQQIQVQAKRGR